LLSTDAKISAVVARLAIGPVLYWIRLVQVHEFGTLVDILIVSLVLSSQIRLHSCFSFKLGYRIDNTVGNVPIFLTSIISLHILGVEREIGSLQMEVCSMLF
jgi:hypothetical protein